MILRRPEHLARHQPVRHLSRLREGRAKDSFLEGVRTHGGGQKPPTTRDRYSAARLSRCRHNVPVSIALSGARFQPQRCG